MKEKKIMNNIGPDLRALRKACGVNRSNMADPPAGMQWESILAVERQSRSITDWELAGIIYWLRSSCGDVLDKVAFGPMNYLSEEIKDIITYTGERFGLTTEQGIKSEWVAICVNRRYDDLGRRHNP